MVPLKNLSSQAAIFYAENEVKNMGTEHDYIPKILELDIPEAGSIRDYAWVPKIKTLKTGQGLECLSEMNAQTCAAAVRRVWGRGWARIRMLDKKTWGVFIMDPKRRCRKGMSLKEVKKFLKTFNEKRKTV